ncbi:hypothetical protein LR48_Vigan07g218700 [Vigna angularis]|uniref:Uncharacterized protein n=1 Tax=Phaseolus angularis TaxID=3914 RepID=A0A0L9V0E1_PHAAN|nr:hypothetical protein LR48_Vigan07g218700 [Vigna angularis]
MRLGESKKPWKLEGCGREKRSNDVLRVVSWLKVLPWMEVLGLCQYGVVSVENGDKERDICGFLKKKEIKRCGKFVTCLSTIFSSVNETCITDGFIDKKSFDNAFMGN